MILWLVIANGVCGKLGELGFTKFDRYRWHWKRGRYSRYGMAALQQGPTGKPAYPKVAMVGR